MALIKETGALVLNANTILDWTDVQAMAANRPGGAALVGLGQAKVEALLITAWSAIESEIMWFGDPVATTERIVNWPRSNVGSPEGNFTYANNVIPQLLKEALFETVFQLSQDASLLDNTGAEIQSMTVTGVTTTFVQRAAAGARKQVLSDLVARKLRFLGRLYSDVPTYTFATKFWGS